MTHGTGSRHELRKTNEWKWDSYAPLSLSLIRFAQCMPGTCTACHYLPLWYLSIARLPRYIHHTAVTRLIVMTDRETEVKTRETSEWHVTLLGSNDLTFLEIYFWQRVFKGKLNTDTSPQNFWTTFLPNDLTEKLKRSAVANTSAITLPLYFSCLGLLRRFQENLTKPFYFYLSRTSSFSGGTPSAISLALKEKGFWELSSTWRPLFTILWKKGFCVVGLP